jgi:hypothetical protein
MLRLADCQSTEIPKPGYSQGSRREGEGLDFSDFCNSQRAWLAGQDLTYLQRADAIIDLLLRTPGVLGLQKRGLVVSQR